jgi:hypothetical protein
VQLLTVHKAKGLEFPVVILADITAHLTPQRASRHLDAIHQLCAIRLAGWSPHDLREHERDELTREREEGVRVAYVAATRARDLLVVPVVGDARYEDRWISVLNGAVYPAAEIHQRQRPESSAGCPPFGQDSVCDRPDGSGRTPATVSPGRHVFDATAACGPAHGDGATYAVTWWDPYLLARAEAPSLGLRQSHLELIAADAPENVVAADLALHEAWQASRETSIAAGSMASLRVETATRRASAAGDVEGQGESAAPAGVRVIGAIPGGAAVRGRRFGHLVHELIASVPLHASRGQLDAAAAQWARLLGASDGERVAAADLVSATLGDEILERARAASERGRCRRETPITWRAEDGTLIEGQVDLAFEDEGGWVVVDFKTDAESADRLDVYQRQVGIYARAVAAATGRPARGLILQLTSAAPEARSPKPEA